MFLIIKSHEVKVTLLPPPPHPSHARDDFVSLIIKSHEVKVTLLPPPPIPHRPVMTSCPSSSRATRSR